MTCLIDPELDYNVVQLDEEMKDPGWKETAEPVPGKKVLLQSQFSSGDDYFSAVNDLISHILYFKTKEYCPGYSIREDVCDFVYEQKIGPTEVDALVRVEQSVYRVCITLSFRQRIPRNRKVLADWLVLRTNEFATYGKVTLDRIVPGLFTVEASIPFRGCFAEAEFLDVCQSLENTLKTTAETMKKLLPGKLLPRKLPKEFQVIQDHILKDLNAEE